VFHIVYFQKDMFQCDICHDFEFEKRYEASRHIFEQHSGFGWKCLCCRKIFGRRSTQHKGCAEGSASTLKMAVCLRSTSETGEATQKLYNEFMESMDSKMRKVSRPRSGVVSGGHRSHSPDRSRPAKRRRSLSRSGERGRSTVRRNRSGERGRSTVRRSRSMSAVRRKKVANNRSRSRERSQKRVTIREPVMAKVHRSASVHYQTTMSKRQKLAATKTTTPEVTLPVEPDLVPVYVPTPIEPPQQEVRRAGTESGEAASKPRRSFSGSSESSHESSGHGSSTTSGSSIDSTPQRLVVYSPVRGPGRAPSPHVNHSESPLPKSAASPKPASTTMTASRAEAELTLYLSRLSNVQEGHIILNIGGQKFETSSLTMEADPSSVFAAMVRKDSPFKPTLEHGRSIYFMDRDPSHFRHILNYLRNGGTVRMDTLPRERRYLREMQAEAAAYHLAHLVALLQQRCDQLSEE
jgi:hypothetical protein